MAPAAPWLSAVVHAVAGLSSASLAVQLVDPRRCLGCAVLILPPRHDLVHAPREQLLHRRNGPWTPGIATSTSSSTTASARPGLAHTVGSACFVLQIHPPLALLRPVFHAAVTASAHRSALAPTIGAIARKGAFASTVVDLEERPPRQDRSAAQALRLVARTRCSRLRVLGTLLVTRCIEHIRLLFRTLSCRGDFLRLLDHPPQTAVLAPNDLATKQPLRALLRHERAILGPRRGEHGPELVADELRERDVVANAGEQRDTPGVGR
mmetsp:Transcript_26564/g.85490  ORF Transcript_26564/g.85490 Transcript_26564/m.85490 type:complete len:266 (+) Transcript_26564:274-1071(+)